MPNSLAPSFFRLEYHSEFGPHTQTVPTLQWNDVASTNAFGKFNNWSAGQVDALDMITDMVDAMLPFYPPSVIFDRFTIFTQASPDDDALPQTTSTFTGKVGTGDGDTWYKAVQLTLTMRTSNFGIAKYVFLDAESANDFDKIQTAGADILAFINVVNADANGFSGLDNGQPAAYLGVTKTLNERLRKSYRMD